MKFAALLTILLLPLALEPSGCAHQIEADPDDDDDASSGSSGQTNGSSSSGAGAAGSGSSTGASVGSGGNGGTGVGSGGNGGAGGSCGNGMVDIGEQCDDGDLDNTDACLVGCVNAACGDGFVQAGVEQCDDGNVIGGDGCSAACTASNGTYGPVHTFEGLSSSFYITQAGCSNSGGDAAGDALYFCQHFYSAACIAEPGYVAGNSSTNPMMHSGTGCYNPDPTGISVTGTSCVGGPCKIGDYGGPLGGLSNIICSCP